MLDRITSPDRELVYGWLSALLWKVSFCSGTSLGACCSLKFWNLQFSIAFSAHLVIWCSGFYWLKCGLCLVLAAQLIWCTLIQMSVALGLQQLLCNRISRRSILRTTSSCWRHDTYRCMVSIGCIGLIQCHGLSVHRNHTRASSKYTYEDKNIAYFDLSRRFLYQRRPVRLSSDRTDRYQSL